MVIGPTFEIWTSLTLRLSLIIYFKQNFEMLREIREMGLYIDEHRDFREEMVRMREGRGKKAKASSRD